MFLFAVFETFSAPGKKSVSANPLNRHRNRFQKYLRPHINETACSSLQSVENSMSLAGLQAPQSQCKNKLSKLGGKQKQEHQGKVTKA